MSGTSDTVTPVAASGGDGCPCGRNHAGVFRKRKLRKTQDDDRLSGRIVQARFAGKETCLEPGFHEVAYHGDCSHPLRVPQNSPKRHVVFLTRCRKCGACRRAKRNYWGFAAQAVTRRTMEAGNRTWFGTLTLDPEWQARLLSRARDKHPEPQAPWWADPRCDERFKAVRNEFLVEVQKYWKRLRKHGARFRYMLVFEQHKSGLPHAHFLLHEENGPILKKSLRAQWPLGFFQASLVGGRARNAAAPDKAAWYAVKYLTKSAQARLVASRGYCPDKRPSKAKAERPCPPSSPPPRSAATRSEEARADARVVTTYDAPRASAACDEGREAQRRRPPQVVSTNCHGGSNEFNSETP